MELNAKQLQMVEQVTQRFGAHRAAEMKDYILSLSKHDVKRLNESAAALHRQLAEAITNKVSATSDEAQLLMDQYYQQQAVPYKNLKSDEYVQMVEYLVADEDAKQVLNGFHPLFTEFLLTGVKYFAQTRLQD